jgi:hypothetical protein
MNSIAEPKKKASHRQIMNALGCGHQMALRLYALDYRLGDPVPAELEEEFEVSKLARKHGVVPRTIKLWISLGWNPVSRYGMVDPEDPTRPLTTKNPAIRAESIRRANERRGEKEKVKRAEERAIRKAGRELDARRAEEAKAEVKRTPIRQTADVEAAIARAKLDARERLAARAEACDAIRQAKIEAFVDALERRAEEKARRAAEERAREKARRAAEAEALLRSAERLAELEEIAKRSAKPKKFNDQRTMGTWAIDKGVRDVLLGAPMPLSAVTLGRRLKKSPADVVDALERLEERGQVERADKGPNGLTYRVKR